MEEMTSCEVCAAVGISRHAVHGYEKAGLVSASGKYECSYLLHDVN